MKRFLLVILFLSILSNSAYAVSLKKNTQKAPIQSEALQAVSEQANVLYAQNDINEAYSQLLSIPDKERTAQNWLLLGNILQDQGKTNEAVFMYNQAIQTDELYYKAHYNLGNIYLNDGKPNMAIEEYKKVIKLKPDYAYAHYNLACAYIKLEKYSKARYELYNAIDLKNTVADFHYNLAYVLKKLNKEKEAKKYLEYYNKLMENNHV